MNHTTSTLPTPATFIIHHSSFILPLRITATLIAALTLTACGNLTDPATRLAADLRDGASQLGSAAGSKHTITHAVPSHPGQCTGPYKVQFDRVGAIIIWCCDDNGNTISSHSTSSHRPAVDTLETTIIDNPANSPLTIDLERINGRASITKVQ